jgi:hypothetical protein
MAKLPIIPTVKPSFYRDRMTVNGPKENTVGAKKTTPEPGKQQTVKSPR